MSDPALPVEDRLALTSRAGGSRTEIRIARAILDRLPSLLEKHAPAPAYAVIADDNVSTLYGDGVRDAILSTGSRAELFTFPAGEASKTPERWAELVERLADWHLGRDGCLVTLGGGVSTDLGGFVAATYARGVRLVHVPTSLLAMIDAAIGGKTGVDLRAGKNMAGAFHDPVLVVVDPQLLDTLPLDELRCGLAEAVKHGAIADAAYLDATEESADAILRRDPAGVDPLVTGSIRVKLGIVARDTRESGERATLNFGHTIAHAIERVTHYRIPHGPAVGLGMVVEARIGERLGVTEGGTAERLERTLEAVGLPVTLPPTLDPDALLEATRTDKKTRDGTVRYALIARIGAAARTPEGLWTHTAPTAAEVAALTLTSAGPERGGEV